MLRPGHGRRRDPRAVLGGSPPTWGPGHHRGCGVSAGRRAPSRPGRGLHREAHPFAAAGDRESRRGRKGTAHNRCSLPAREGSGGVRGRIARARPRKAGPANAPGNRRPCLGLRLGALFNGGAQHWRNMSFVAVLSSICSAVAVTPGSKQPVTFGSGDEPWRARAFPCSRISSSIGAPFDRIIAAALRPPHHRGSDRGQCILGAKAKRRGRHRRRGLHRVRCLCGGLPQRLGCTVHGSEEIAHLGLTPRPPSALAAQSAWFADGRQSFGNCSWHGECQEACPSGSALTSSLA